MIGKELIEKKYVSLAEVKALISARKKEQELKYEQEQSFKYCKENSKLTEKKALKLFEELMKLEGMTERLAIKIIDILPEDKEVMSLLPLKSEEIKKESLEKAFEITKKYIK